MILKPYSSKRIRPCQAKWTAGLVLAVYFVLPAFPSQKVVGKMVAMGSWAKRRNFVGVPAPRVVA
jgi:hypothetical protein